MSSATTLSYDAVAQLFARYGWANDMGDLAMLEECFTEDIAFEGTIAGEPAFGPFESGPTVLGFFSSVFETLTAGQTRHVMTNFRLTDRAHGEVRVFAYLTYYTTEAGVQSKNTGTYDCQVTDTPEPRFSSMRLALDGPPS